MSFGLNFQDPYQMKRVNIYDLILNLSSFYLNKVIRQSKSFFIHILSFENVVIMSLKDIE